MIIHMTEITEITEGTKLRRKRDGVQATVDYVGMSAADIRLASGRIVTSRLDRIEKIYEVVS